MVRHGAPNMFGTILAQHKKLESKHRDTATLVFHLLNEKSFCRQTLFSTVVGSFRKLFVSIRKAIVVLQLCFVNTFMQRVKTFFDSELEGPTTLLTTSSATCALPKQASVMTKLSIVWMRRNLRIEDNKVLHAALDSSDQVLPIFIFDTTILARFPNPQDRRLSFIANILHGINRDLSEKFNGELTVFHGDPVKIVPKLAKLVNASTVYADEDFEPEVCCGIHCF